MRHRLVWLVAIFGMLLAAPELRADPLFIGPLSFGNGVPLSDAEWIEGASLARFTAPGISQSTVGSSLLTAASSSFSFSLLPGWTISRLSFGDFTDVVPGTPGQQGLFAASFLQRFTFCTTAGVCWSATAGTQSGNLSLLPVLSLTGTPAPGNGLYEETVFTQNGTIQTQPLSSGLNIFLTNAASPVPEPESFLMLATGALGAAGVLRQRPKA